MMNANSMFDKSSVSRSLLLGVIGLSAIVWLWADVSLKGTQMRQVGKAPIERHTIVVNAEHKVVAVPDVATVSIGLTSRSAKVSEAQAENTKRFNDIVAAVQTRGVSDADVKTDRYSIYQDYEYTQAGRRLLGYVVSQGVTIKMRDLSKVGEILDAVGQLGANEVGGLQFSVDNQDTYVASARTEAIKEAHAKARQLAKEAGFTLGKLVSFSEGSSQPPMPYYANAMKMLDSSGAAPSIEAGSQDIVSNVSLVFEIE